MGKPKKLNLQRIWILIFSLIVFTELLDFTASSLFPAIKYSSIIIVIGTLPLLIVTIKRVRKKYEELRQSKLKLKNIFDTLDVAIWSHDLKSDTLLITSGIEKLYGYTYKDFYQDLDLWKKVIYPEDISFLSERAARLAKGETVTSEYRIVRLDGEVRWIQDRGFPTLDSNGNFVDFNSVLFDITDRKESEDRYRSLVEMSPDIIAVVSNDKIEYINEAGCKLVGASNPEELTGQSPLKFVPEEIVEAFKNRGAQQQEKRFRLEFQVKQLNGETIDVEMASAPIFYEGRFAVQVVGRDITERKIAEKTIQKMAYHDSLTGLPNRNRFRNYLNEVLNRQQENKILAVLFLDLDRFKIINDTKGHTVGDMILQKVADRLEMAVQNEGFVSRQGGDEFIILLEDIDKERASVVAQRILNEFSEPIEVYCQEFFVTPSIGISLYPNDGKDEETLLKNADTAMYQAKERGKNNFCFYSSNLNGLSIRKMELENGLRKALEQNQFTLHYQPQVSLETGELVGIEALIRWQHPEHGFIAPSEFIPLAEETGLIVPIGKWVIWEASKQRKTWETAGLCDVPIAVNVSVRQFEDEHLIEYISTLLEEVGLQANQLELEITESIMQNLENSTIILNKLKKRGVLLSIDDFGTGYSSLSYLKHLPIDKIKIDKSFVDDILYHSNQGIMVKTIIDMGVNFNFTVIAEGIETDEQLAFLKKNKCKIGQGNLFSKPIPACQMEEYLLKRTRKSGITI
ncbi:EAL domain-containing protein [Neobacillus sp. WH10]|uniref:putative bifunctional diguanylate cyclase/phosphodiesterase n=1 Tax=Neobacillus sp. WH10 TaxID=3047873 RepID=UPI0024C15855|nr:EAL domain-containing protein [Neobacillus sp. WH10]WHY78542.1 EAL domain-containing protein [Neobacillus sp. WH10]